MSVCVFFSAPLKLKKKKKVTLRLHKGEVAGRLRFLRIHKLVITNPTFLNMN